jgi:hypothetical protein
VLTPVVQRWRDRRGVYRPAGEVISTHLYEVARSARDGGVRDEPATVTLYPLYPRQAIVQSSAPMPLAACVPGACLRPGRCIVCGLTRARGAS